MLRGFYNAAQAMLVKQRELDAISNNVANMNTAGYKKDEIVTNTFKDELILVQGRRKTSGHFFQTYVDSAKANLEQSNFEFSESKFDMAIWGNMYFNVTAPSGTTYQTRDGQFELDNEGYLTLNKAGRVQGQGGDIFLGSDDFVVDTDGYIRNPDGTVIDQLRLTYIPPDADVAKVGNSLFSYDGGAEPPEGETFDVIQGAFEKSNVDGNKEMTQAMEVQRIYEANSKILMQLDALNGKASTIASLSKN